MREIINGLKLTPSLGVHLSQATALKIARCLEDLKCENSLLRAEKKFQKTFYAQQPEWISVEDRLPEKKDELCLVYRKNGSIGLSVHYCETNHYWSYGDVTHWMPLPEPPKPKEPTFKDVFLKAFPKAPLNKDGVPGVCIADVFPWGIPINCEGIRCHRCWNQPYFEEEGEAE